MTVESFVSVSSNSDFPIQNIPFGVFSTSDKVINLYKNDFRINPVFIYSLNLA